MSIDFPNICSVIYRKNLPIYISKQSNVGKLMQNMEIVPDLGHLFIWGIDKVENSHL